MSRVGIDLGTTNTVVAVDDHVLRIGEDGANHLPSVVAFLPNGKIQYGATARRRRSIDGANTIFSSKRIIGRRFGHSLTRAFRERYPFDLVDDFDQRLRWLPVLLRQCLLDPVELGKIRFRWCVFALILAHQVRDGCSQAVEIELVHACGRFGL